MKKVYLLIIKAFIKPFIVTFFIVMFVLLMLFLFKYIDDLIGKGFEWHVILRLLLYASATNVAMALPLAMLLSSIMTFGNLGESYELVAIKSIGVSLQKAMRPLFLLVTVLSISAFLFSDYMLPVANLKMGSLLYDVRNQKASFLIEEGIFNNSIEGYAIRVQQKGDDGRTLKNVLIYDQTGTNGNISTTLAKEGVMYKTNKDRTLVLELKDGVRYEETSGDKSYNPRQRFTRYRFKATEQKFPLDDFEMKRTDEGLFKSNYAMLNLRQLKIYKDSTTRQADSAVKAIMPFIAPAFRLFSFVKQPGRPVRNVKVYQNSVSELFNKEQKSSAISYALNESRSVTETLTGRTEEYLLLQKTIRRYSIEYNRKFTLSVSCLVLFSIGAPLGAIIRKGGLGLPVVMSIIFFLIYHIISTIGEKSAKEGDISPVLGMWIAIFVLTPLGIFLTYKAASDSALFDADSYKQAIKKFFNRFKKNKIVK
ncbi:membrane protein, putative [Arcticibacter svalbardensis MN12-7]|uniref:Membrane protein, putative n=1 Tax=Arcticibacter svalbardensis MN12-7 TaxID=1150600 RepID=R9GM90_9SPHI|nr:LptF/LptG family permease [Arcticibacter svalbardensis]EOR92848.1 membrane protein, putative [Arcticibacter svalbardensis MN12-7]